jgi:NAD(P)-dependent dehydrogenase (short-subunit alcohol dehydrogenase family)
VSRKTKKVCLLTGSAGTLGSEFCRLFAERYHIAAVHREGPPPVASQRQRFVDPLEPGVNPPSNAHPVFAVQADLTDDSQLSSVVDLVLARFQRIDLLVNAARHPSWGSMLDVNHLQDLELQFQVNAIVPVRLAAAVAQKFWRDCGEENVKMNRNVVNVSSTAGLYVYPDSKQASYSASKAALNHLTCHMANEFRSFGVRVNAVAPNTFPALVTTESAAQAIVRLDRGKVNGRILVLDETGRSLI